MTSSSADHADYDLDTAMFVLSNLALHNIEKARQNVADPRGTLLDELVQPSAEHAMHSVDALQSWAKGEPQQKASDGYGLDATVEDGESHKRVVDAIRASGVRWLSSAIIVGEEAELAEWAEAERAAAGTIIVDVDPIDGSSNLDTAGEGFSTNFLVYVKRGTGRDYQLLLCVTVTSSGWTLTSMHRGDYVAVYYRNGRGPIMKLAGPLHPSPREGYIAAVAMTPKQRERIAYLMVTASDPYWGLPPARSGGEVTDNPAPSVSTMGGAPATIHLALLRRDAMVTTEPQTLHDSTGVPALLALGLPAYDADGPVDRTEVMKRFNQLVPPYTPGYKPIPALVIGRDPEFTAKVAAKVFHVEPAELVAVPKRPRPDLRLVQGDEQ